MKIGYYPGSFNSWHEGHANILQKSLKVFDRVIIAQGHNPEKQVPPSLSRTMTWGDPRVWVTEFDGLMVDHIATFVDPDWIPTAVIRGLRNGYDLQFEANQQYWNEDLGLAIPVVFFITDRNLSHISSSTIRAIKALRRG